MARYDHLPIYRAAFDLAVHLEQIVRHFDRYHKYTLGTDLRTGSRRILERIIEANESRERRLVLEQLRQDLERLKVLARLCHESGGFRSTRAYLYVAEQVVALARQNEGWLRSTAAPADLRHRDRSVVTDPGGAQGSATVTVAITTAGESPCQDRRVTCAAVGGGRRRSARPRADDRVRVQRLVHARAHGWPTVPARRPLPPGGVGRAVPRHRRSRRRDPRHGLGQRTRGIQLRGLCARPPGGPRHAAGRGARPRRARGEGRGRRGHSR